MYADTIIYSRSAQDRDTRLPHPHPGILTRHFAWVVGFCMATLLSAPLIVGWTAGVVLLK
jgi:hypothetical protein